MKRFVVTSAVPGAKVNTPFLAALKAYCKRRKAQLVVIPCQALYKEDTIDKALQEDPSILFTRKLLLNSKFRVSEIPINPEAVDPIMGLDRLEGSWIFASPKQRMKSVAKANHLPRVLMTPGAVTKKYYRNTRRGMIAGRDHVDGAIIVEIGSDTEFHFRQVQADSKGRFIDLGTEWSGKGSKWVGAEALIPGDWHSGFTDAQVVSCLSELNRIVKPKQLVLHDFFDGISVNHHIEHKIIQRSQLGELGNLKKELETAARDLDALCKEYRKVVVVRSNHDEFLDRWLEAGSYVQDATNHEAGLELALAKVRGHNPLEYALRQRRKLKNVHFLKMDENFKLTDKKIEHGVHGHRGPNGARGSSAALEKVYGNIVIGHHHAPEILRGLYCVGTSTHLKLSYNDGPSSWLQTACITYKNGSRQLINFIDGRWRA